MSKHKKQQRNRRRPSRQRSIHNHSIVNIQAPTIKQVSNEERPYLLIRRMERASTIVIIIALIIVLYTRHLYELPKFQAYRQMYTQLIGGIVIIRIVLTRISITLLHSNQGYKNIKSINIIHFLRTLLSIILLTLAIFPPLYLSEFPEEVTKYINTKFPQLSAQLVTSISNVFTWLISTLSSILGNIILSILGNFVYDMLKKRLGRRTRKVRHNNYS